MLILVILILIFLNFNIDIKKNYIMNMRLKNNNKYEL